MRFTHADDYFRTMILARVDNSLERTFRSFLSVFKIGDVIAGQQHFDNGNSLPSQQTRAKNEAANQGKAESELRAAARRHGFSVKELAPLMGMSYGHLC